MKKMAFGLLKCLYAFLGVALIVTILRYNEETPYSEKGKSFVTYEAKHFFETHRVYDVDATSDYIFLSHGQNGIISAFDWNGNYCFSIVTTADGNGSPELYCCEKELFIIDKNKHVFVYVGVDLKQDYQIESLTQGSKLRSDLRERKNNLVSLSGANVVDVDNRTILVIPK